MRVRGEDWIWLRAEARMSAGFVREAAFLRACRMRGASARCSGERRELRDDMARPSGSRTVGWGMISTGTSRSRTMRRMTASCWKSFSPKTAAWHPVRRKSLRTTVQTPSKWPGRVAPQRPEERRDSETVMERSGWYMDEACGAKTRSTPSFSQAARSESMGRG